MDSDGPYKSTGIPKKGTKPETYIDEWPCEDRGRDWNKMTNSLELEDTHSGTHQKLQKYNGGIFSKVFQRSVPKGPPLPISGFTTQSFCGWIDYSCSWATKSVVMSLQPLGNWNTKCNAFCVCFFF